MSDLDIYIQEINALNLAIELLFTVLPDSKHVEEDWGWCWNELSDESQERVKQVRRQVESLRNTRKLDLYNNPKTSVES